MKQLKITVHLLSAYKTYLQEEEKSDATIQKYMHDLKCFSAFLKNSSVSKNHVTAFKNILKEKYALTSANSILAAVNSFLRFAGRGDLCTRQFKIQKRVFCAEDKELTKGEYLALVRTAEKRKNERLSLVIQTICATGIRVSELRHITLEAITKGNVLVNYKGKSRTVFIVAALRKKLLRYAKSQRISSGMLFVTKNGRALDRSNIWQEMKNLCFDAGVAPSKVFPHNLRHLFARTFYSIEKDIARLADILGHSNINTTRIYTISSGAEHQRKIENMRLII